MAVLRNGTPSQDPRYADDDSPGSVNLGIFEGTELVACSTWMPKPWPLDPEKPAMQLRGMAVAHRLQGSGVGATVLAAGIERARIAGCAYVWARARDNALYFYERRGFETVGDQFVDDATGLGHHLVVQTLT